MSHGFLIPYRKLIQVGFAAQPRTYRAQALTTELPRKTMSCGWLFTGSSNYDA